MERRIPTLDDFVNEAKKEIFGVVSASFQKAYERLKKPTTAGKEYKYKYKDGGFDFKSAFIVNQNISNNVKLVQMSSNIGYYAHQEYLWIKDVGMFRVNKTSKSELAALPKEYHNLVNPE
ncbi:MAG TPA: hypothetical protein P5509_07235 [Bacteroidales bacterium]|nr:hypothetical protein [Bacteroidales bacterium]